MLVKGDVVEATQEKILELASEVSGKLSLVKTRSESNRAALLARLLRVVNNPNSQLEYNEMQLVLQACVRIGNLTL